MVSPPRQRCCRPRGKNSQNDTPPCQPEVRNSPATRIEASILEQQRRAGPAGRQIPSRMTRMPFDRPRAGAANQARSKGETSREKNIGRAAETFRPEESSGCDEMVPETASRKIQASAPGSRKLHLLQPQRLAQRLQPAGATRNGRRAAVGSVSGWRDQAGPADRQSPRTTGNGEEERAPAKAPDMPAPINRRRRRERW